MTLHEFNISAAEKLPDYIRFGTSSWTYPGWKGLLYHREYRSEKEFNLLSLEEYAAYPIFRTVCLDSTFYTPPKVETLTRYQSLVPDSFKFVSKVWERITIPTYPNIKRYGSYAGKVNPDFLNADFFDHEVLKPFRQAGFSKNLGPLIFQFPTFFNQRLLQGEFLDKLETFLTVLDPAFQYAVEVRNPDLLNERYFSILNRAGATHCFNHWEEMASLLAQMKSAARAGGLTAPFYVARLITPLCMSYEQAGKLFEPYTSLKEPIPTMREDVLRLVQRAAQKEVPAYITVSNRLEGNSPQTVDELVTLCAEKVFQ